MVTIKVSNKSEQTSLGSARNSNDLLPIPKPDEVRTVSITHFTDDAVDAQRG